MTEPKTMMINDVEYVRKDDVATMMAQTHDGVPYCIVRSYGAGVFAGFVSDRDDATQRVTLSAPV